MLLADAILATLPELRAHAESMMTDTCTVTRPGAATTTGGTVTVTSPTVYTGKCKVQTYLPYEQKPEVGERTATVQRYSVHFAIGAFAPAVGDVVTITASIYNAAALVGKVYRIAAPYAKTYATAQRCYVDEVVA